MDFEEIFEDAIMWCRDADCVADVFPDGSVNYTTFNTSYGTDKFVRVHPWVRCEGCNNDMDDDGSSLFCVKCDYMRDLIGDYMGEMKEVLKCE